MDKLYDEATASKWLAEEKGVRRTTRTLRKLRCIGGGPAFRRFGRRVYYTKSDLDQWVEEGLSAPLRSTSEREAP